MKMFAKLWADDAGIVALEYLLVATIVGLGLVVGLAALEGALNAELTELANAILALSQGYEVATQSTCKGTKQGSQALDTPDLITFFNAGVSPVATAPSSIDQIVCTTP
jgi:Flp pilus assembly pilin Flp